MGGGLQMKRSGLILSSVFVRCVGVFQHALRLLAFGQMYKVLNMDPLPASKPTQRLSEGVCVCLCVRVHVLVCVWVFGRDRYR